MSDTTHYGRQDDHIRALLRDITGLPADRVTALCGVHAADDPAVVEAWTAAWTAAFAEDGIAVHFGLASLDAAAAVDAVADPVGALPDLTGPRVEIISAISTTVTVSTAALAEAAEAADTAGLAAGGLATRHLIGRHGYTQQHYMALVGRVAAVLGRPLHPGDPAPAPVALDDGTAGGAQ